MEKMKKSKARAFVYCVFLSMLAMQLGGCFWNAEPEVIIKEVRVPVPIDPPEPPSYAKPDLPIHGLDRNAPPEEVADAYVISVKILMSKVEEAIMILNGYRK